MGVSSRERILLVEQGASSSRASILDRAGFEVVRSSGVVDPVRLLENGGFALLVTDLLPGTSGLALLKDIRKRGLDLPVILFSDRPTARIKALAARRGARLCRTAALRRTVERAVRHLSGARRSALLPFRNRRGEQINIASVTATDAKNEFGSVLDTAIEKGAIAITRHETAKAVLLSVDEFNALVGAREGELDTLGGEFDALLAGMQAPGARSRMKAAFGASPTELGKAAVMAAHKDG